MSCRGLTVAVIGPLSTFSEIEPSHPVERVAAETGERLAAHRAYPAWLSGLAARGEPAVPTTAGTWFWRRPDG